MDLENVTIKEIYPLGTKDFSHDNCDLSDRDGGIHNYASHVITFENINKR